MFNRILVPLDGSPLAERAISHAGHFARIFGGSIILLQVLDPTPNHENASPVEPLNWQIRKTEADLYLKGIAARLRAQGIPAEHAIREGRTPENIVDFAQSENIDLLVLSTHGAGGLTRWNTSSVLVKVIEKVYLPVLIIRAYHSSSAETGSRAAEASQTPEPGHAVEAAEQPAAPASEPGEQKSSISAYPSAPIPVTTADAGAPEQGSIHYQRILIPIDSSRRAECSLTAAVSLVEGVQKLGDSEGGEPPLLVLTAVLKPPELPLPSPYPEEIQKISDQFMNISRDAVRGYLNEISARIQVKTETRVVENDSVSLAIHEVVEKENIDLVVLCAHGRTGQVNWPYGSVARNYIEHGVLPVLVIQDVSRSQVRPTAAELAAEKYGRR